MLVLGQKNLSILHACSLVSRMSCGGNLFNSWLIVPTYCSLLFHHNINVVLVSAFLWLLMRIILAWEDIPGCSPRGHRLPNSNPALGRTQFPQVTEPGS